MNSSPDLTTIPSIGPKTIAKLAKLDINNTHDLLLHFPSRYIDFSHKTSIKLAEVNTTVSITGEVIRFQNIFTRSHKNLQKAIVSDNTGFITLIWFNQPYLSKSILIGQTYSFAGTVSVYQNQKTIIAPEYGEHNTGKIIPVYPETKGLTSKWFRKSIQVNLPKLLLSADNDLPAKTLKKFNLYTKTQALSEIHCPTNSQHLTHARRRLALDEILSLQATSYLQRQQWLSKTPNRVLRLTPAIDTKLTTLINNLPFTLTNAQLRVWQEVQKDLTSSTTPANRLIQGDVGSGKTIIALLAAFLAHLNKTQALIVAPTEILAQQHYLNFQKILKKYKINISLLTGNSKVPAKDLQKSSIIIATHAAFFQQKELFLNLSVLVIDEQHKFGVKQRSFLSNLSQQPHTLTMTATPIPRTLSLTLLGNLSLSYIDELPKDRLPIKTFLVPQTKKNDCYKWVENQIKTHQTQAYIVCPFIEESEANTEVKAAIKEFEHLQKLVFPKLKLALIHGKTPIKERQEVIEKFKENKINILVTTPIIEVGVDIPNSSIMIILSADHFGLAQLHQLRGRVGRGSQQSYCYLFTETNNEKATARLQYLEKHANGLKIAEYDLKVRGPGEIFSLVQHGFPSLKLSSLNDLELISESQKVLEDIINQHPDFNLSYLCHQITHTTNQLN